MAYPVILFNASTGSDTAASGAGPGTAITGTAAAHTGGSSSTTITLTNTPDLSGVLTDGSHVLWLKTASGRQFSKITAADNGADTVTTEDAFNIDSGSAVNYAIGGKRATFDHADNRLLFSADAKAFWTISTETGQTVTSSLPVGVGNTDALLFTGNGSTITFNFNGNGIIQNSGSHVAWRNFTFVNTHGTKTSSTCFHGGYWQVRDCVIGHSTNKFWRSISSPALGIFINCEVAHSAEIGVVFLGGNHVLESCYVHDSAGLGVYGNVGDFQCRNCIFANNGSHGVEMNTNPSVVTIANCTFNGNAGSGVNWNTTAQRYVTFINNIMSNNGAYGVVASSAFPSTNIILNANNNYFGNATAARSVWPVGTNDVALDPDFAGSGDYNIGSNLASIGYPASTFGNSSTESYPDIGAAQREESPCDYPDEDDVRDGVTYSAFTGNLVLPAEADVELGVQYGTDGTEFEGTFAPTCDFPSEDDVRDGVDYDDGNLTGNLVLPAIGNVRNTIQYGTDGTELTGTYTATCDYPSADDVRDGVEFDNGDETGNLVLPDVEDVQEGVTYGTDGEELTGTFVVPDEGDVRDGTTYGADDEFEGTGSICPEGTINDSPEEFVYLRLTSTSAVTNIVGSSPARIYPVIPRQGVDLPTIAYIRESTEEFPTLDGNSNLQRVDITIHYWHRLYADLLTLGNAIELALNDVSGTFGAAEVQSCRQVQRLQEETDEGFHGEQTYAIWL